ncbi:PQQ-dependent sugar dehydrogenase [Sphingobium sp. CR28]|uniref:PQQ-dependent sugar dehydrogenase n=1 Tax=Sphingobium sp. CR28 TaxID=3400272 RepID=UPI003FEF060F
MKKYLLWGVTILVLVIAVILFILTRPDVARLSESDLQGREPKFTEQRRQILPTVKIAKPVGWAADAAPTAPRGLSVTRFAAGLDHPRTMLLLPNGDILVAETNSQPRKVEGVRDWIMSKLMGSAGAGAPSPDRIRLLRDANGDGVAEQQFMFLTGLTSPYGMALVGDALYVANTDALLAFPYKTGDTKITAKGRLVLKLPANGPNYHWTKSLVANKDGTKLYIGVGSNSNVAETGLDLEDYRALIMEVTPGKAGYNVYASGLRNPTGLAIKPDTGELWATVNERDMLGSDLVPDYLTQVEFAAFYGWPWNYWGGYEDKRVQPERPDLREYTRRPDYALGVHVAPLGFAFTDGSGLGAPFTNGAFVALHGSWNRVPPAGYKVVYVPFDAKGRPTGKPIDLLTGFLNKDGQAQGRPVWPLIKGDGSLLVSDDTGGVIWRIRNSAAPERAPPASAPVAQAK